VLEQHEPVVGELRVVIRSMLLRTAVQPDLPPEADADGDGLPNRGDNCPLIANPLQTDENEDGIGDACEVDNPIVGNPPLLDSDADTIPDVFDNCFRVANLDQRDAIRGADLIGDACEQFSDVSLPSTPVTLTFPVEFTPEGAVRFTALAVDFNSRAAIRCNEARTVCKLDPGSVTLVGASF
jgi:hypothetical protein